MIARRLTQNEGSAARPCMSCLEAQQSWYLQGWIEVSPTGPACTKTQRTEAEIGPGRRVDLLWKERAETDWTLAASRKTPNVPSHRRARPCARHGCVCVVVVGLSVVSAHEKGQQHKPREIFRFASEVRRGITKTELAHLENGKEGQSKQASTTRVGSRQNVGKKGKKKKEVVARFLAMLLIHLLFIRRRLPISFLSLSSLHKSA